MVLPWGPKVGLCSPTDMECIHFELSINSPLDSRPDWNVASSGATLHGTPCMLVKAALESLRALTEIPFDADTHEGRRVIRRASECADVFEQVFELGTKPA